MPYGKELYCGQSAAAVGCDVGVKTEWNASCGYVQGSQ